MAKKSTKTILAALKTAGVEIEDQSKVEGALDDIELSAGEFVGADEMLIPKDEYREIKDDLTKLRKRAKDAESERDEAKEANEAGDSVNKTKATKLQARNDELEPLVKSLLTLHDDTWKAAAATIPDTLKDKFRFAEEDKELSTDDLIHNVNKLTEYQAIEKSTGVTLLTAEGDGEPDPKPDPKPAPGAPRIQNKQTEKKLSAEQLEKLTPSQKMEHAYAQRPRE